jgi:hypothetical protein
MIYRGTSLWLWLVEGIILIFVIALVMAFAFALLIAAAALIVGFFVWWGALEARDRWIDPPVEGMVEWQVRRQLYGNPGPPWRHRLPPKED